MDDFGHFFPNLGLLYFLRFLDKKVINVFGGLLVFSFDIRGYGRVSFLAGVQKVDEYKDGFCRPWRDQSILKEEVGRKRSKKSKKHPRKRRIGMKRGID